MKTMLRGLLAILFGLFSLQIKAQTVGLRMMTYADPARSSWAGDTKRPLHGAIWYPAHATSIEKELSIEFLKVGKVAVDASFADPNRKYPLVVMSHGTGGSAISIGWLAQSLAQHGFIVAAVNHHGNTAAEAEKRAEGFLAWWERPRDVSALIDQLLADPSIGVHIDRQRIGVAGFSLGGYTALASVGARLNFKQWLSLCTSAEEQAQCNLPPEAPFSRTEAVNLLTQPSQFQETIKDADLSYKESRIRAAFVIAPVLVSHMRPESFSEITVPIEVVVGEQDDQAPPERNAKVLASNLPQVRLSILPTVTHYTFLVECTATGKSSAPQVCEDQNGVDRSKIHQMVGAQAVHFFEINLK